MPLGAIRHVDVDHVVSAGEMGLLLSRLVREPVGEGELTMSRASGPEQAEMQQEHASLQRHMAEHARRGGLEALGQRYEQRMLAGEERSAIIRQAFLCDDAGQRLGEQPL